MRTKHINLNTRTKVDEIVLHFPGGAVSVTRRPDGEGYWAHIRRNQHGKTGEPDAVVTNVHVDCEGMDTFQANVGDMARKDFFHLAVCIKPGGAS